VLHICAKWCYMITRSLLATLIVLYTNTAYGQEKFALKGPKERKIGQLAIIKLEGTKENVTFDCGPKNDDWKVVKFQENGDYGIIFATEKAGIYHFFAAVADKTGKIETAVHQVVVVGTSPPIPIAPPITDFNKAVIDAVKADIASGNGTENDRKVLAIIYKTAAKITVFDKNITKIPQFYESMDFSAQKFLNKGVLPMTRNIIAKFQESVVNPELRPDTVLTDDIRNHFSEIFSKINMALESK